MKNADDKLISPTSPNGHKSNSTNSGNHLPHQKERDKRKKNNERDENKKDEPAARHKASVAELLDGESCYPLVCGVLAVKVVSAEIRKEIEKDAFIMAKLRVRNVTRYTGNGKRWGCKLLWGEIAYFPTRVVRNPQHPFNLFQIDILSVPHYMQIDKAVNNDEYVVGSVPFHMHDLVRGSPSMGSFSILKGHRPVGSISLEFYFTYGSYGYGYSPQFKGADSAESRIEFSMFPRRIPEPLTREEWNQTLHVATVGPKPPAILDKEGHATAFPSVHARMKRLQSMEARYVQIDPRARLDKLTFLYKQINTTSKNQSMSMPVMFVEGDASSSRNISFFQNYMKSAVPLEQASKID